MDDHRPLLSVTMLLKSSFKKPPKRSKVCILTENQCNVNNWQACHFYVDRDVTFKENFAT